jgi:hypothetical protein
MDMKIVKKILKVTAVSILILLLILSIAAVAYGLLILFTYPSNDRDWERDMAVTTETIINGNLITIKGVRDAKYRTSDDYDLSYLTNTYNVNKLEKAYFFTNPFGSLSAHTMLGFEFSDGQKVVLSVEIRREKGEVFSGYKGVLRAYELIYVWGTEDDLIKLRTNIRENDGTYMYPLKMSTENIRKLFVEAALRTNELKYKPEFYNTITNNCTTNLAVLLQKVYNKPIIVDWRYLAPAYAEGLAIKYDLIDAVDIESARARHNISPLGQACKDCSDYSGAIRGF